MPWHLETDNPKCAGVAVVKDDGGKVVGCHKTKAGAKKQLAALYANEGASMDTEIVEEQVTRESPPRENLFRAVRPGVEMRAAEDGMPTMVGHFAVFDEWTEIKSMFEGNFMERLAPGAFRKTISENGERVRVLFQHGRDPQIGDKVLGKASLLEEDERGAHYEVPLFDTSYNRDLIPGLEADQYGASFRFSVKREEFNRDPERSPSNPEGLPERTIREVDLYEFGPVTFPAYSGATAGVRSVTDEMILGRYAQDPDALVRLIEHLPNFARSNQTEDAPSTSDAAPEGTSEPERREPAVRRPRIDYTQRRVEAWRL